MAKRVTFHRNGKVTVKGVTVGEYRSPDPSGAPWARRPVWIFTAFDGRVNNNDKRGYLGDYALSAYARLMRQSEKLCA